MEEDGRQKGEVEPPAALPSELRSSMASLAQTNPQSSEGSASSPDASVPSLHEVLEALARRDEKYRAPWLRFEYSRTVNDYENRPARTEFDTLIMHDGNLREGARAKPDGL